MRSLHVIILTFAGSLNAKRGPGLVFLNTLYKEVAQTERCRGFLCSHVVHNGVFYSMTRSVRCEALTKGKETQEAPTGKQTPAVAPIYFCLFPKATATLEDQTWQQEGQWKFQVTHL